MYSIGDVELFLCWLAITFAISGLAQFSRDSRRERTFYEKTIRKPSWAPQSGTVFAVVWTILYVLMSFSAYRVRRFGEWEAGVNLGALVLYVVLQAVLATYTLLFFGLQSLWASTLSVAVALVLAGIETYFVAIIDLLAVIPFILLDLWLIFALALSISIWYNTNGRKVARNAVRGQMSGRA